MPAMFRSVLKKFLLWYVGARKCNGGTVSAGGQVRVAFILSRDFEWDVLASVYKALSELKEVCVTVFVDKNLTQRKCQRNNGCFEFSKLTPVWLSKKKLKEFSPHVLFVADPVSFSNNWWLILTRARIIYIPYGISISAAEYSKTVQYNRWIHHNAWKIVAPGEFFRDLYGKFCLIGNNHVVSLGYPKYESLINDRFSIESSRFSNKEKKIFLWNIQFRETAWSTWESYGEFILDLFSRRNDALLICRPHPFFFGSLGSEVEADRVRKMIVDNKNTLLDESSSMAESFNKSDALITDGSSIIYDYWWSLKPMLYLRSDYSEFLHEHAFQLIKNYHYIADRPEPINRFVELVCSGGDPKQTQRECLDFEKVGMVSPMGSGRRIAEFVVDEIQASEKTSL